MENNKAYLKRIHWVFLLAIVNSILAVWRDSWLLSNFNKQPSLAFYFIASIISLCIFYIAVGVVTSYWKEALSVCAIALLSEAAYFFLPASLRGNFLSITFFLLSPAAIFIFFILKFGWKKKLLSVYCLLMAVLLIYTINYFATESLGQIAQRFGKRSITENLKYFFSVVFKIASFVFQIICICELLNYMRGHQYPLKTRLLNLGNDYDKLNSLLAFWALKVMMLVIVFGGGFYINNYIQLYARDGYDSSIQTISSFRYTGIVAMLCIVLMALFLAWYMRKFLLEIFITYNIKSKFLYWFSLFPVIGFITFAVILTENAKQRHYNEKVTSIAGFAARRADSVTIVFFILLFLRLVVLLRTGGDITVALYLIVSSLLFTWLILDKTGYYVNVGLSVLLLAATIVTSLFTGRSNSDLIALVFSGLLLNLVHLILIFPVYHFPEFAYMPGENPEPEKEHLFAVAEL